MSGPWAPNAEWGVGQYAALGGPDSELVVGRFLAAAVVGGRVRGSTDNFSSDFLSYETTSFGVVPAAWLYHAIEGRYYPLPQVPKGHIDDND